MNDQIDNAAQRLAQAIRFKTIASGNPDLKLTQEFLDLHLFLEESYPRVYQLNREAIGQGMLFHLPGADPKLKPILLMAHMDVVPGGDELRWTHPPFGGVIRDGFIWGRGALDMKGTLIALLEAVEYLLSEERLPERGLYLAFGCDEELGGKLGAGQIGETLAKRDIQLAYILDEGGFITQGDLIRSRRPVALVGVVEKGRTNVEITATADPGHASMPGPHSAVGILSREICRIEKNPFPIRITPVLRRFLHSLAPHTRWTYRLLFKNLWLFGGLVLRSFSRNPRTAALIRTTQAVTMIQAGEKANVLPEQARAVVNVRLLPGDTLDSVQAHYRDLVDPDIRVTMDQGGVEPTDTAEIDAAGFRQIEKCLEQVLPQAVALPYIMVGGTDSRHYSRLCANIYRFTPYTLSAKDLQSIHGTNERLSIDNLALMIRFLTHFIGQVVAE